MCDGNEVVKAIRSVIKEDKRDCMFGEYKFANGEVEIEPKDRGGVYGIAIKREEGESQEELYKFVHKSNGKFTKTKAKDWKALDAEQKYYPLYWGKDINLGYRLFAHTKSSESTGTVQLATRGLDEHTVIFGAVFCANKEDNEKNLKDKYPVILKTTTTKKSTNSEKK